MGRTFSLAVLLLANLALGACSDADWENAMTYLPLEHGVRADQTNAPAQTSADTASVAAAPQSISPSQIQPPAPPPSQTFVSTSATPAPAINEHCRSLANQRASDGQYMGMDEDAQKQEYDRTYADCATWDAAHRY